MDHDHDDMLRREEAIDRVLEYRAEALGIHPVTTVDLDDLSGRVLAEAVAAETDQPPYDYATMDGFAFDATDDYLFNIVDEVFPEDSPPSIDSGEAVRIATGAPLPEEANVVLKRKVATDGEGQLDDVPVEPGTYVYERGSNVERGEQLFCAGERLSPKDALLLRDVGCSSIPVYEPFSVGILATGTEMVELTNDVDLGPEGFEYAVPVTVDDGKATPLGHVDSVLPVYENTFDPSVLSSSTRASRADDFVLTTSRLDEGETVNVTSYSSFS